MGRLVDIYLMGAGAMILMWFQFFDLLKNGLLISIKPIIFFENNFKKKNQLKPFWGLVELIFSISMKMSKLKSNVEHKLWSPHFTSTDIFICSKSHRQSCFVDYFIIALIFSKNSFFFNLFLCVFFKADKHINIIN